MKENALAEAINILGRFCGKRDVEALNAASLRQAFGISRADVMVLFGGSILAGGDVLAQAIGDRIADNYVIVGGAGHTTDTLRNLVRREYPFIETAGLSEAAIFQEYLEKVHGCRADFLETKSTNCGNNITYLLALLEENHVRCESIILCQDATMQARMDAGMRKYVLAKDQADNAVQEAGTMPGRPAAFRLGQRMQIINFASYAAAVRKDDTGLSFEKEIHGMWSMDRYIDLLMGEIPRLTDDALGYGPQGKGFIAHVDIPDHVRQVFELLKTVYGREIRWANPEYASH